mmetsp:Transcript_58359/g.156176  ORF Transcript_58359/g.156176 Transcript_58359/m.156176 type:complete len:111 (+) Transcript_58359:278-610(+)
MPPLVDAVADRDRNPGCSVGPGSAMNSTPCVVSEYGRAPAVSRCCVLPRAPVLRREGAGELGRDALKGKTLRSCTSGKCSFFTWCMAASRLCSDGPTPGGWTQKVFEEAA